MLGSPFFVIPKDPRSPYAFTLNSNSALHKKYCSKVERSMPSI